EAKPQPQPRRRRGRRAASEAAGGLPDARPARREAAQLDPEPEGRQRLVTSCPSRVRRGGGPPEGAAHGRPPTGGGRQKVGADLSNMDLVREGIAANVVRVLG
ncbi:unnamed protein product, partial [Prorocentrum cordatum]